MKNIYTVVFSLNNTNSDENYLFGLSEIDKIEKNVEEALSCLEYSPRKKLVDDILKFACKGKR